jgi:hypothetical protein
MSHVDRCVLDRRPAMPGVLSDLPGFSHDEIAALRAAGVTGERQARLWHRLQTLDDRP